MSVSAATPGGPSRLRQASARTRRRRIVNRMMEAVSALSALAAVLVLAVVTISVFVRGIGAINLDFFTKVTPPPSLGTGGGGVLNAIVGTALIVAMATGMAVPIGVLVAVYTKEFARKDMAQLVRLALDVLNGIPSIVVGIFVFGLFVVGHGQAAWIASFALAVIMIPLVARSTQEVLDLVPETLRDASAALGARRWKTVVGVVLPSALGGIVTGTTLAIARVAGETAPILFTSSIAANLVQTDVSKALATLPFTIFVYSESPAPSDHQLAWAAALLLMVFVLISSFSARFLLARTRRRLEGTSANGIGIGRLLGRLIEPMSERRRSSP